MDGIIPFILSSGSSNYKIITAFNISLSTKDVSNAQSTEQPVTDTIRSGFSNAKFAYITVNYVTTPDSSKTSTTMRIEPLGFIIFISIPFYVGNISGYSNTTTFTTGSVYITFTLNNNSLSASRTPTYWDSDGNPYLTKYAGISGSAIIFGE